MIGRVYFISVEAQAQTAAKTLIEIAAPADAVVFIDRAYIGQSTFDTSEVLSARIQNITTTGTGTAHTPIQNSAGDPAFGGTVKTNMTVEPTYTSVTPQFAQSFNVLGGWLFTPANDEETIMLSPGTLKGIRLNTAPSASMSFDYGATIREVGG